MKLRTLITALIHSIIYIVYQMRIYPSVRYIACAIATLLIIQNCLSCHTMSISNSQQKQLISSSRQSVHKLFRNVFVFKAPFHPHSLVCTFAYRRRVSLPFSTECGSTKERMKKCGEAKGRKQKQIFL